ncbi:MAG: hypothetical protein KDD82_11175 [Planctomycetes bacterium]|nr:hypothetical protein [Planctomycetota bacterium]
MSSNLEGISKNGARRVYRILARMAWLGSDKRLDGPTRAALEAYRTRLGLSPTEGMELEDSARAGESMQVGKRAAEQRLLFDAMIDVGVANREVNDQQLRYLKRFAKILDVPKDALRARLEQHAAGRYSSPSAEVRIRDPHDDESDETGSLIAAPSESAWNEEPTWDDAGSPAKPGAVVLLGANKEAARIDLGTLATDASFAGFRLVPPGLHYVALKRGDRFPSSWVQVPEGGVVVQRLHPAHDRLVNASAGDVQAARQKLEAGQLEERLASYPFQYLPDWRQLTIYLGDPEAFPPRLREEDPGGGSRFENALYGTHDGDGNAFLTEMSYAFLRGFLDGERRAFSRWSHLLQAGYHCGPDAPQSERGFFTRFVRLVVVQLGQLPSDYFAQDSFVTYGARYLTQDLRRAGTDDLLRAASALEAFLDSRA